MKLKYFLPFLFLLSILALNCSKKPTPTSSLTPKPMFLGVNLEGADFGSLPGVDGQDFKFPQSNEVDYWASKNVSIFRVGFLWERLQPNLNQEFAPNYRNQLVNLVNYATSKKVNVLLNPQNFMRYNIKGVDYTVGSSNVPVSAFVDLWTRLAVQFKDNPRVFFGLNNEPHDMSTALLISAENQAIAAIRSAGAKNLISVPGNGWTGARSWFQTWTDNDGKLTNAQAALQIQDPLNNFVHEIHHYFDSDAGGAYNNNTCSVDGKTELSSVVSWAKSNNKKILIGEYGTPNNAACQTNVNNYLQYVYENNQIIVGAIFWAAGPWWGDNYKLSIYPKNFGLSSQVEDSRVSWLQPYWSATINPMTDGSYTPSWSVIDAGTVNDSGTSFDASVQNSKVDSGVALSDAGSSQTDAGINQASDAGVKTTVDAGAQSVDAGVPQVLGLKVFLSFRNQWSDGICVNGTLTNTANTNQAWHKITINLGNGSLRDYWDVSTDKSTKWGSKGNVNFYPVNGQWLKANSGSKITFGFCMDTKTPNVLPTVSLLN